MRLSRSRVGLGALVGAALAAAGATGALAADHGHARRGHDQKQHGRAPHGQHAGSATTTPIRHLVVIYQENVSFDHYFGTYPNAANLPAEPAFHASATTPSINGLNDTLLTQNPNSANPSRLDRSEPLTCDQNHDYTAEQQAFDHGLMDKFVQFTNTPACSPPDVGKANLVMDYYDGNTVTGLWNYAQHFAMNDNSYSTTFGPSTPGALNLVSGQTHGAMPASIPGSVSQGSVIGDPDPAYDNCSGTTTVAMSGKNIGDLLNSQGTTWGFFQGGFTPTSTAGGKAVCGSQHSNIGEASITDYSAHHEPFQYYKSTSNPQHLPPSSPGMIGRTDQANHQYDLSSFWSAADAGHLPAVSFLKAAKYQDGHAGYSDPLDEQHFLVNTLNGLQHLAQWKNTAVIIAYDDSDGWYDHVMSPIVSQSNDLTSDALTGSGHCGTAALGAYQDRCGYGPRQPLLVISPFARVNSVDHTITDQTSILRFIEDNWSTGRIGDQSFDAKAGTLANLFDFQDRHAADRLLLDPASGQPLHGDTGAARQR